MFSWMMLKTGGKLPCLYTTWEANADIFRPRTCRPKVLDPRVSARRRKDRLARSLILTESRTNRQVRLLHVAAVYYLIFVVCKEFSAIQGVVLITSLRYMMRRSRHSRCSRKTRRSRCVERAKVWVDHSRTFNERAHLQRSPQAGRLSRV